MTETSSSIQNWAEPIFGPVGDLNDLVDRAALELAELKQALADGDTAGASVEAADVVILLHRVAALLGTDLATEVEAKMAINRTRTWVPDGNGAGKHV